MSNKVQYARIPVDASFFNPDDASLIKKSKAADLVLTGDKLTQSVSFGGIRFSPLAGPSAAPEVRSKNDGTRLRPRPFNLVVPALDAKITKRGVNMKSVYNSDTGKYEDPAWSLSADKHEMTLSLNPAEEPHKHLLDALNLINEHAANQFAAHHNLHRVHVLTPAAARSTTIETSAGDKIHRHMLKMLVDKNTTFRYDKANNNRSVLGSAGPFFRDGNKVNFLACKPEYVMVQQSTSPEDESIFHYTVSVRWTALFADVGLPPLREDGKTYEQARQDYAASMQEAEMDAINDYSQYCEEVEAETNAEMGVQHQPGSPNHQNRSALGTESQSEPSVGSKRALDPLEESPLRSKPAEQHAPPAPKKKKKARSRGAPDRGAQNSSSQDSAPPSLAHLLG